MRSLEDRVAFIISIYQDNKFIQSVISIPKKWKIYTSTWNSFDINLGGWAGDYNIKISILCRITTCNECPINPELTPIQFMRLDSDQKLM